MDSQKYNHAKSKVSEIMRDYRVPLVHKSAKQSWALCTSSMSLDVTLDYKQILGTDNNVYAKDLYLGSGCAWTTQFRSSVFYIRE